MKKANVTAEDLHTKMIRLAALVEMFEESYIGLAEIGLPNLSEKEKLSREKACSAVYLIHVLTDDLIEDMQLLCEHMEICSVIHAAAYARARSNNKEG